jgi:3-deoxy-7-phosphoheptulonate synthase
MERVGSILLNCPQRFVTLPARYANLRRAFGDPASMLIVMKKGTTQAEVDRVTDAARAAGFQAHVLPAADRTAIAVSGSGDPAGAARFESLPGVDQVVPFAPPYRLASREALPDDTRIRIGSKTLGSGNGIFVIAGPCAVENEDQLLQTAQVMKAAGVDALRGGAYKPRSSPYSFQGLGRKGLELLAKARETTGLPVISEALDEASLELVAAYADVVQIGARNMQNFELLKKAGRMKRPILLKRGMSATLDDLLLAAEYVMAEGQGQVVLCERGIRTFSQHSRYTLDLSIVPAAKQASHLPIIVDPSHAAGHRDGVPAMARAAVAAGAHGVMLEVHPSPESALSDGRQSLLPAQAADLIAQLRDIAAIVSRKPEAVR